MIKTERTRYLHALITEGLTFAECVQAFAEGKSPDEQTYIDEARRMYQRAGVCEIDPETIVSVDGDLGAYVLAWMWVYAEEAYDENITTVVKLEE
jgi:hypothetical protein